ncbi:MAG: ubiquinone biosynthesis protein UbiE [Robiginitomaculum sp.]|nr:MAG: ubiquinone biosynthesis protein UbiE [Robiginitomaculum sp.]
MDRVTTNFTGSIPEHYEAGLVPVVFIDYAQEMTKRVVDLHPEKVLELASGTGVVTRLIRDRLAKDSILIASDLNEPMLVIARQKFKEHEKVVFEVIDAMALPFTDQSINVITCQFGVMFFPDKVASYGEAYRVLKTGGHYVFSTWDSLARNIFAAIVQDVVEAIFPDDPPGFYKIPFHYNDPGQIRMDMEKAGFSSVKVEQRKIRKAVPSLDAFAHALVFGNPLCQEVQMRNGDADAMVARLQQALLKEYGQSAPVLELNVLFVTGQK